jgi:hypothetical protein
VTPKQFLVAYGAVLIVLGIFGFVIGGRSMLGGVWRLDLAEDVVHTAFGVLVLAAVYVLSEAHQRWLVLLAALTDVGFSLLGFALRDRPAPNLVFTNLDNPGDNILHLALGLWGLAVFAWSLRSRAKPAVVQPR